MPICQVCLREPLHDQRSIDVHVCASCSNRVGVIPMPPARRPPRPCSACQGTKLIRAIPREVATTEGSANERLVSLMTVGFTYHHSSATPFDPRNGLGLLELYVCKACGFVEWYCADPQNIPIGPQYMTEEIDCAGTPYR